MSTMIWFQQSIILVIIITYLIMECFIAKVRMIRGELRKGANRLMAILLVLLSFTLRLFSQDSCGWLYIAQAPAYTTWRPNDIVEVDNEGFFVAFWDYQKKSHILKLSEEGELVTELEVSAIDTTVIVSRLFVNHDICDGYTAIAICRPESGNAYAIMTLQFDENLGILQRKVVSFPDQIQRLFNLCVLKQDHNFIIAITDNNYSHYLVKLDATGEILEWNKIVADPLYHICNLFNVFGEGESLFGMYANVGNVGAKMGVLVFDDSLQLIRSIFFDQWQNEEEGGQICQSYLYDAINSMMIPAPDSSGYLISSRLRESLCTTNLTPIKSDRSTIIAKTDLDFVMQDDYVVVGHLNDTIEEPAYYESIDYYPGLFSQDVVYQCTIQGFENELGWPMGLKSLGLIVTKADGGINVLWKKRFLSEKEFYPFAVTATKDGGCAIAGMVYDYNQEGRLDLFVLRVAADGSVGLDEIQEESMAFVYPNPARGTINIGGVEAKESEIYNSLGQCVKSFCGNEANVEPLAAGIYMLRVTDSEGLQHTLRFIVNK